MRCWSISLLLSCISVGSSPAWGMPGGNPFATHAFSDPLGFNHGPLPNRGAEESPERSVKGGSEEAFGQEGAQNDFGASGDEEGQEEGSSAQEGQEEGSSAQEGQEEGNSQSSFEGHFHYSNYEREFARLAKEEDRVRKNLLSHPDSLLRGKPKENVDKLVSQFGTGKTVPHSRAEHAVSKARGNPELNMDKLVKQFERAHSRKSHAASKTRDQATSNVKLAQANLHKTEHKHAKFASGSPTPLNLRNLISALTEQAKQQAQKTPATALPTTVPSVAPTATPTALPTAAPTFPPTRTPTTIQERKAEQWAKHFAARDAQKAAAKAKAEAERAFKGLTSRVKTKYRQAAARTEKKEAKWAKDGKRPHLLSAALARAKQTNHVNAPVSSLSPHKSSSTATPTRTPEAANRDGARSAAMMAQCQTLPLVALSLLAAVYSLL